jgi:hypothetical protein
MQHLSLITDEPIRTLAIIIVLVLLVLLAAVSVSRRRGERIERKVDDIMRAIGIGDRVNEIDREFNRHSRDHDSLESEWGFRSGKGPRP